MRGIVADGTGRIVTPPLDTYVLIDYNHPMTTTPTPILDPEQQLDSYASYTREATGEGEAIVDCLIEIMEDDKAKPYERLDAQLLLDSIGFGRLALERDAKLTATQPASPPPPRPANPSRPRRPVLELSEETLFLLPPLVRKKTDGGKRIADFLCSVIRGQCAGFEPRHRIRAAKHLAARAFPNDRDPTPDLRGPSLRDAKTLMRSLYAGRREPETPEAAAERAEKAKRDEQAERDAEAAYRAKYSPHPREEWEGRVERDEKWYDFSSYGAAEYERDCYGLYARVRILGSDEAVDAANRDVMHCGMLYDYPVIDRDNPPPDYDPPASERAPDPYGRDSYGYKVMLYVYRSVEAVRAANKGVLGYRRRVELGISDDPDGLPPYYLYTPCEYICDHCDCENVDCCCECACECHSAGGPVEAVGRRSPAPLP